MTISPVFVAPLVSRSSSRPGEETHVHIPLPRQARRRSLSASFSAHSYLPKFAPVDCVYECVCLAAARRRHRSAVTHRALPFFVNHSRVNHDVGVSALVEIDCDSGVTIGAEGQLLPPPPPGVAQ